MDSANAKAPEPADYSIPGLRIQLRSPDDPWPLVVRSARRQEDWVLRAHRLEDKLTPDRLETVIIYRGEGYWIFEEERAGSDWVYKMKPAPVGEAWKRIVELDPAKMAESRAFRDEHARIMRQARNDDLIDGALKVAGFVVLGRIFGRFLHRDNLLGILAGWLPARKQERVCERFGVTPCHASAMNALFQVFLFSPVSAYFLILFGDFFLGTEWLPLFALAYFALEGIARWLYVMFADRPCGWPPIELADWIWRRTHGIG